MAGASERPGRLEARLDLVSLNRPPRPKDQSTRPSPTREVVAIAFPLASTSISSMTLDEALQTIAAGSGFTYRVEKGVLRIDGL